MARPHAAVPLAPQTAPSPLLAAIALHRRALDARAAVGDDWGGDRPSPAWIALDAAEDDAFAAMMAAPCSGRDDAAALIAHLAPLAAEGATRHPTLDDCGDVTCVVLSKVLAVFAAVLAGDGALPPHTVLPFR